jgi:hypothetical protein
MSAADPDNILGVKTGIRVSLSVAQDDTVTAFLYMAESVARQMH